jgi:outer membrane murein-binding lipoprotein Lpp
MKKILKVLALSIPLSGLQLTSCASQEDQVTDAATAVSQLEADLEKAEADYQQEVEKFKEDKNLQLIQNEKSIREFNTRIANDKSDAKAEYEKTIKELDKKNSDLKMRIETMKFDTQSNWESFKTAFAKEMDELGKAIQEFTSAKTDEDKK